jgi:hypothetical protein
MADFCAQAAQANRPEKANAEAISGTELEIFMSAS